MVLAGLPGDVGTILVKGLGSYIRSLPAPEVPASLRRFRTFRPQTLVSHRAELLQALEDPALRARIGHWLATERPPLGKSEAKLLRIACERPEGWERQLGAATKSAQRTRAGASSSAPASLESERARTRRARDELKAARDEVHRIGRESDARAAELRSRITELEQRVLVAEKEAAAARKSADQAARQAERERRRSKTALERMEAQRDTIRKEVRELRKQLRLAQTRKVAASAPGTTTPSRRSQSVRKRTALRVPKGRLEDDPGTLAAWLGRNDVWLVVDGYNVGLAPTGYGNVSLETMRKRLIDDVGKVAPRLKNRPIIVFDGSDAPAGTSRRRRGGVDVEYSKRGEIADDHIVAKVESLPPEPVVVVTNDKELQERVRGLAATVATSDQFLKLVRG